jgi:hypothetical protein
MSKHPTDLAFLENWIETIAIILSRGLTTPDTDGITSWSAVLLLYSNSYSSNNDYDKYLVFKLFYNKQPRI